MAAHPAFGWLWKSWCLNKHKIFFWLLLKNRISTRFTEKMKHGATRLQLRLMQCKHNRNHISPVHHLYFASLWGANWTKCLCKLKPAAKPGRAEDSDQQALLHVSTWMCRNNKIFKNTSLTVQTCRAILTLEISSLLWRATRKILPL